MPKSRGRRKPAKKSPPRRHLLTPAAADGPVRSQYDVGRVESPTGKIGGLLLGDHIPPDLMVELLPPMLWLEHATGLPTNLCVSSCATLHFAYAELGIDAQPRAVDLVVINQRTDQRTMYGRPDPYWTGSTFHGHCVLWLPRSKRCIDPTVEQYPEVRRYKLGPICGRIAASMATPEQQADLARGELPPGTAIGVQRQELLLLYTAVDDEFDNVVMSAPIVLDNLAEVQRSGRNLATQALNLLRHPDVIARARRTPHPRVRALLDLLADAETNDDDDDLRFILPSDPTRTPRRLDELQAAQSRLNPLVNRGSETPDPSTTPGAAPRAEPPVRPGVLNLDDVKRDRPRPQRGLLARLLGSI